MPYRRYAIAILSVLLVLALPCTVGAQRTLAEWTILVYLDADNNLEKNAIDDFLEMAAVPSSPAVNVVVQFDRINGYDSRYGDWAQTLRFRVTQGMTPEPAHALADLGEANMGDPQTLTDFYAWGRAAYPARRTALVIWNHGDGWRAAAALKEQRKAIAWDDTNGGDALDLAELRGSLSAVTGGGAHPIDLLAFDACLMAMIEIDAQMRPYVGVRTASEETEPGTGYPFDAILGDLVAHPTWDAVQLGERIVTRYYEEYGGETQSAVDLGAGYATLIAAVDQLAGALIANQAALANALRTVRSEVQQFQVHYVDLRDLSERLADATAIDAVDRAAGAVVDAVEGVVLAERHGGYWPGANGITIYFPAQPSAWDSAYDGENGYLAFTADTRWDDFLVAYLKASEACDPDPYEPDNAPQDAAPIGVDGVPQSHGFCPESDAADWVSFAAQQGRTYTIETSDLEAYSDTVIRLYDVDGRTLLAEDDDSGAGWASRLAWTSPATARYYVQVSEYFGRTGADSGYALRVTEQTPSCTPDPYEPDGSPAGAPPIAVGARQERNFCGAGDVLDWAALEAIAGQAYAIETSQLGARANTVLALVDVDGTTVLRTDDDGGAEPFASRIDWVCPAGGTYYLRVHEAAARTGPDTAYTLSVAALPLTIRGAARMQGRSAHDGIAILVAPHAVTTTTDLTGAFAIQATAPCTVTASHPGYLPATWTIGAAASPEITLTPATLWGGDINGDRTIDILDIVYIGAQFGGHDPLADLNGDGSVDILDIVLTASNFGKEG
ncbi:MAG: hypothetical protein JXA09_04275 [Anaerolineae bacterium]|nr:hypothetical protein [Anaerolineae bacterium]